MPRRSFGKYEVLARLATGGAASIFLARQPGAAGFHKLVVLKTLLPERACDADFVAMFLDEARLAARLNHPNCVQIYDLGRVRGVYYISMEYIFGETLWNLLTTVTRLRTPLPPAHVASIVASACDGLHHAHELKDTNGRPYNLVHRDVSPQNVMITFEGQTKVVDFGIAKAETGRAPTMAGIVKGKFSYMSPEQITGGEVDRRSDIFSLGIVLFECLASRRLYRGDTPEEIAKLILEHRAPRLRDVVPDIPLPLDEICACALARHPSKRFASASVMGDELRNYLDDVRHNQSASATAKLLAERFEAIPDRRQAYEAALNGTYDEAELLRILDARAVRDIDLFPDEGEPKPDFVEPVLTVANNPDPEPSNDPSRGWRVELDTGGRAAPDPIEMLSDSSRLTDGDRTRVDGTADDDGDGMDPTRIDAAELVEGEAATQFDPDDTEQLGESAAKETIPTSAAESTHVDEPAEDDWEDRTRETDFEDEPALQRIVAAAPSPRAPSYGGAAAELEERLASIVASTESADATLADESDEADVVVFGIDPPPHIDSAATSESSPMDIVDEVADVRDTARAASAPHDTATTSSAPYDIATAPLMPYDATAVPRGSFTGRVVTNAATNAPAPLAGRYGLSAVVAALGFGVSIGILIGVLVARMVFGAAEAPQRIVPVPSKAPPVARP